MLGDPWLQGRLVNVSRAVDLWVPQEDNKSELGFVIQGNPEEELVRQVLCEGRQPDNGPGDDGVETERTERPRE